MCFSGRVRATSTVRGAPKQTPSAEAEIRCPASGIETPRLRAMSGRMPIITNSAIPSANVPNARAIRLFFMGKQTLTANRLQK